MKLSTSTLLIYMGITEFVNWTNGLTMIPKLMEFCKLKNIASVNLFLCENRGWTHIIHGTERIDDHQFLINWNLHKSTNTSLFGRIFGAEHHRIGIVLNMSCQSSWDVLQTASEHLLFNASYAYVLLSDETKDDIIGFMEPLKIQFDSDVTLFTDYEIYDLFRTAGERPLTAVLCGNYSDSNETVSYSQPPRWSLDGAVINAATVIKQFNWKEDGFERFIDYKFYPEVDALSRFSLIAHQHLEYLCNFKTNLSTVSDWGYFQPEVGHFDPTSMFGWLEQDKVEFGLALSRLFTGRLAIAFYAPVTFNYKTCVLFRHPPAGASYDGFARPFSTSTWLVMGIFVAISSLLLNIIKWRDVVVDQANEPGYTTSLLNILAIFSLQGSYINSLRVPTRVLSVALHLCGLMLYSYYGAEIVGFLLTPSPRTITTVEKLVESRMDMWAENVSFHRNHFESKVGASATKYYELGIKGKTRDKDKFLDMKLALRLVKKGGAALYGQNAEMYTVIENTFTGPQICSLHSIPMLDIPVSVTVRKKSPYREIYYRGLSRFIESGILDVENRRWHTRRPVCIGTESNSPVKFEATLIAQLIFAGGLCLTIAIFVAEKGIPPKKKNKELKKLREHDFSL